MASEYYDLNSTKIQLLVSLCMGSSFIFIGMPIWWKTTEVYRADLPYSEISNLKKLQEISMIYTVNVVTKNYYEMNQEMKDMFLTELNKNKNARKYLNTKYEVKYLLKSPEQDLTVEVDITSESSTFVKLKDGKVSCRCAPEDVSRVLMLAAAAIKQIVIREEKLEDLVRNIYSKEFNSNNPQLEMDRMRSMPASSRFDILFSVFVSEPHTQQVKWNIAHSVECYLQPIINKLKPAMQINVGSQVLLYVDTSDKPLVNKTADSVSNYYLSKRKLSLFVNPIESRLGSQQSPNPTLNFVVYLTPRKYCPLGIELNNGQLSQTNAFLVPRWGAVILYNECDKSRNNFNEERIMKTFVAQLKILLGIPDISFEGVEIMEGKNGFKQFELKHLFLSRTVEYLATTSHTLTSLADLLEKITNIVINDEVAEAIYSSVVAHARATRYLAIGNVSESLKYARIAYEASEKAFFDPTLLQLLYFPEDQKFAIYIPLFLPISIPLMLSLVHAVKKIKQMVKKDKLD